MLEEWRSEAGIKVLDGWNFQVSEVMIFCPKVIDSLPLGVLLRVSPQAAVHFLNSLARPQVPCLLQIKGDARWKCSGYLKIDSNGSFCRHGQPYRRSTSSNSRYGSFPVQTFRAKCVDREIEIVQELLGNVLRYGPAMEDASNVCAELDCLLSFAEAARTFDYRRPRIVEDPIIDIVQGRYACVDRPGEWYLSSCIRHPLQEQISDTFVPNDARLVGGVGFGMCYEDDSSSDLGAEATWSSVVLCTGANACGKVRTTTSLG